MFKNLQKGETSISSSGGKATASKYWKDPKTGKEFVVIEKTKAVVDLHEKKLVYPPDGNNSILSIELIEE